MSLGSAINDRQAIEAPKGTRACRRARESRAFGRHVESEVTSGIPLEAAERSRERPESTDPVSTFEVVECHTHLNQPLEEVARGSAETAPYILEGFVALEVEAAVELRDPPGHGEPFGVGQLRLRWNDHLRRIRREPEKFTTDHNA